MKKEYKNRGSFTVEAAVLIPLILSVVMLLIFFSIYLYNRSAAVSMTGRACVLAAGMEQESGRQVKRAMEDFLRDTAGCLPLASEVDRSAKADLLTAEARVSFMGSSGSFFLPVSRPDFSFSDKRRIQRIDPARVIWGIRIAKGLSPQLSKGEKEYGRITAEQDKTGA